MGPQVTDAGLMTVVALKNLRSLDVSEAQVAEAGVAMLSQASNMEEFALSWTTLTKPMVRALGQRPRVKRIYLNGNELPPAVLEKIRSFVKLGPISQSFRIDS